MQAGRFMGCAKRVAAQGFLNNVLKLKLSVFSNKVCNFYN